MATVNGRRCRREMRLKCCEEEEKDDVVDLPIIFYRKKLRNFLLVEKKKSLLTLQLTRGSFFLLLWMELLLAVSHLSLVMQKGKDQL